jgi:catechol 2,3-dioxygenase-like lactoylglutathione lyase family enzyme
VIEVNRMSTILYSRRWTEMVAFYRDVLGLRVVLERDWFVEFHVAPEAYIGVADSARASIEPGNGAGLTLSWQVEQLATVRMQMTEAGLSVSEIQTRWGALVAYLFDPDGNRIELWAGPPSPLAAVL